ncbi:MAG: protein kinase [Planctomycetota bacterium]
MEGRQGQMDERPEDSQDLSGFSASRPDSVEAAVEEVILLRFQGKEPDVEAILSQLPEESQRAEARRRVEKFLEIQEQMGQLSSLPEERRSIGDFTILHELGRGGMGVVYLARQESLGREVALKLLPGLSALSPTRVQRFLREASALAALRHPNIVPVITAGEEDGTLYFAMERVTGPALEQVLITLDRTPVAERTVADLRAACSSGNARPEGDFGGSYIRFICQLFAQVADALAHAHGCGILHRDIKPANILVTHEGQARLVDFGLSQAASSEDLTKSVDILGTPHYLPPEVITRGSALATVRCDIYSLGVSLYRCLSGTVPFEGLGFSALMKAIDAGNLPPLRSLNKHVPRDLETICRKAMDRDPAHRYPTAVSLGNDLNAFLEYRPIAARPPGPMRRLALASRRNSRATAAIAVAVLLLVILTAVTVAKAWHLRAEANAAALDCRTALAAGEIEAGREAWERLTSLDPYHPKREALRDAITLREAERAVREAQKLRAGRDALKAKNEKVLEEWLVFRAAVQRVEHIPDADRRRFKLLGDEYSNGERSVERLLDEIARKLSNAATLADRAGVPDHPPVLRAQADYYMMLWREALASNDEARMEYLAERVSAYDADQRWTKEIRGLGSLRVSGPEDAAAYLFRYLDASRFNPENWQERLIPVPYSLAAARRGISPGVPALLVLDTPAHGTPDDGRVLPGDHILEVDGRPCDQSTFVVRVRPFSPAEAEGVRPFDRVAQVNETTVADRFGFDLECRRTSGPDRILVERPGSQIECDGPSASSGESGSDLELGSLEDLLATGTPDRPISLKVLRNGETLGLTLEPDRRPGLHAQLTAYPLLFCEESSLGRLPIEEPRSIEPGSYLLVVRGPGYLDLRLPFLMPRGEDLSLAPDLLCEDLFPPEDCCFVAPGSFQMGLDEFAYLSEPRQTAQIDGFWMRRAEVTVGEWSEFLWDPEVVMRLAGEEAENRLSRVPRRLRDGGPRWQRTGPGTYEPAAGSWLMPVESITVEDALAYVEWLDRKLDAEGSPWKPSLVGRREYIRAARGGDRRFFPWGDKFDPGLCKNALARPDPTILFMEPVLRFLGDESPFGVRDLAGSVREWHDETTSDSLSPIASGGSFAQADSNSNRIDSRTSFEPGEPKTGIGLRIVYRMRTSEDHR